MLKRFARSQEFVILIDDPRPIGHHHDHQPQLPDAGQLFRLPALHDGGWPAGAGDVGRDHLGRHRCFAAGDRQLHRLRGRHGAHSLSFQGSDVRSCMPVAIPVGIVLGLVNGFFIYYVRIPALDRHARAPSASTTAPLQFFVGAEHAVQSAGGHDRILPDVADHGEAPNVGTLTAPVHPATGRRRRRHVVSAEIYDDRTRHLCDRRQSRGGRAHRL